MVNLKVFMLIRWCSILCKKNLFFCFFISHISIFEIRIRRPSQAICVWIDILSWSFICYNFFRLDKIFTESRLLDVRKCELESKFIMRASLNEKLSFCAVCLNEQYSEISLDIKDFSLHSELIETWPDNCISIRNWAWYASSSSDKSTALSL